MLKKIEKYIETNNLLEADAVHIVALSGGADSVCLLRVLLQLGYKVHAAHCNFHLRCEESNRDESFCRALCEELGVQLHLAHFDTKSYACECHISIEMAARDLRYSYFEQLRVTLGAADVVVAHHRDDNVETVLMNLVRGTGIKGLQGMKPKNGSIVRPMLCVGREDILCYLNVLGQCYVTDSSNLVDDVVRNKIRLNVIPMLRKINPAAVENISRSIENVYESVKVIENAVADSVGKCVERKGNLLYIRKKETFAQTSPEHVLFNVLIPYGFSPRQIKQIYDNVSIQSGKLWHSLHYTVASDRDVLVVGKSVDDNFGMPVKLPEVGVYNIYDGLQIVVKEEEREKDFVPCKEPFRVTLDADKVKFPIVVRKFCNGDRFRPFGMKGSKLVSDYLTDKKRNYFQRMRQLVVEDGDGGIIWLVGERISQKVVCDENTIKILTLRYIDKSSF